MSQLTNNPKQANGTGREDDEGNFHKSNHIQNTQHHKNTPAQEKLRQDDPGHEDKAEDKFGPGEQEGYNPDDFATD